MKPATHEHRDEGSGPTVLLVIDMIGQWQFPEAPALVREAEAIAPRIARLAERFREAGLPVVYVNDNHGRWRSDLQGIVAASLEQATRDAVGQTGAKVTQSLMPTEADFFVLKPCHSAFFATPLHVLLHHLRTKRVVLTGLSADQCVLATAIDASTNGFDAVVARDCVASPTRRRTQRALDHFAQVLQLPTPESSRIRLA